MFTIENGPPKHKVQEVFPSPVKVVHPPNGGSHGLHDVQPGPTYLERLRRLVPVMLVAVALVVGSLGLYYWSSPVAYSSSTYFLVKEQGEQLNAGSPGPRSLSPEVSRLAHLTRSVEMFDHLIERFGLLQRISVDGAGPMRREVMYRILLGNIRVRPEDDGLLEVTVQNADRALAAQMADEIFQKLEKLVEAQAIADLERRASLYQQMIDRAESNAGERSRALLVTANELRTLAHDGTAKASPDDPVLLMSTRLSELAAQLTVSTQDLVRSREQYEFSLAMLRKENLPNLYLVRRALVDLETSPVRVILSTMILWVAIVTMLIAVVILLWHLHGRDLQRTLRDLNAGTEGRL